MPWSCEHSKFVLSFFKKRKKEDQPKTVHPQSTPHPFPPPWPLKLESCSRNAPYLMIIFPIHKTSIIILIAFHFIVNIYHFFSQKSSITQYHQYHLHIHIKSGTVTSQCWKQLMYTIEKCVFISQHPSWYRNRCALRVWWFTFLFWSSRALWKTHTQ